MCLKICPKPSLDSSLVPNYKNAQKAIFFLFQTLQQQGRRLNTCIVSVVSCTEVNNEIYLVVSGDKF